MEQNRRGRHVLSKEYRDLFTAVRSALAKADPIKLLELGAPTDEYDAEISTILPRLREAKSLDDVERIVHEEFVRWFSASVAGDRGTYLSVSREIWRTCQQLGSKKIVRATNVHRMMAAAETILPGSADPDGTLDPRWQAIIEVSEFLDDEPEAIWPFIVRWGCDPDEDIRTAVATCLLEHLLERHFARFFPRTDEQVRRNLRFADTFLRCWKFGQACEPANSLLFDALCQFARRTR